MATLLVRMLFVTALLVAVIWFLYEADGPLATVHKEAKKEIGTAARQAKEALADVDLEALEAELRETGRVVRRRSAQAARRVAAATEDVRTTAAIESQLALDSRLSALDIDVDTTDGRVTLAGRVDSASDLARAIDIALRQDSVREVISTLQIKRPARAHAPSPPR
jgi:osmotically-inducible protein OsmY